MAAKQLPQDCNKALTLTSIVASRDSLVLSYHLYTLRDRGYIPTHHAYNTGTELCIYVQHYLLRIN